MPSKPVCPACNQPVSTRLGHPAQRARVHISNVGFVHRSCFERNKDKFYSLSMARTKEKGYIDEIPQECVDVTEWMGCEVPQGIKPDWYDDFRLPHPIYESGVCG